MAVWLQLIGDYYLTHSFGILISGNLRPVLVLMRVNPRKLIPEVIDVYFHYFTGISHNSFNQYSLFEGMAIAVALVFLSTFLPILIGIGVSDAPYEGTFMRYFILTFLLSVDYIYPMNFLHTQSLH